jgi:thiamine-monophosphate kinase
VTAAALPLSPAAERIAAAEPGLRARAAAAGDDYELLFAAPPEAAPALAALAGELGLRLSEIGAIHAGEGVRLCDAAGREIAVARPGYTHF